jgi:hypothetical protein
MDQISPPMRIVLAVAVLFGAAYMLFLKPGGDSTTAAKPPAATAVPASASAKDANHAHTGLGKAVEAAHHASDVTTAAQNKAGLGTPSTSSATAPATSAAKPATPSAPAAKPAKPSDPALAKLPQWLQQDLDHKVVALLFTNDKAADDQRTRDALKGAYTAHGKVVKRVVPVSKISRYKPVAEGVNVDQSPTLMVIDRHREAQSLVGYSSRDSINQAIIDALLATNNPAKHVKYLQTVQHECGRITTASIIGPSAGDTPAGYRRDVGHLVATVSASLGTLKNAPVPGPYKALSKLVNRSLASSLAGDKRIIATAIGKRSVDPIKVDQARRPGAKLRARTTLELNAVGVDACN